MEREELKGLIDCMRGGGGGGGAAMFLVLVLFFLGDCRGSEIQEGNITNGFRGTQLNFVDNKGLFLRSVNKKFGFGFFDMGSSSLLYLLSVWHIQSNHVVWTANRESPVQNTDTFVFSEDGNAYLVSNGKTIWSTGNSSKGSVTAMVLQNSGNLVLVNNNESHEPIWQSFSFPTDTLLSGQNFTDSMRLYSNAKTGNWSVGAYGLTVGSGDLLLLAYYTVPQQYWSMRADNRVTDKIGSIYTVQLCSNAWCLYDKSSNLMSQFVFSQNSDASIVWAAVLGSDGWLSFFNLDSSMIVAESTKIPASNCERPEPCSPYYICSDTDNMCLCPAALSSLSSCKPSVSKCPSKDGAFKVVSVGDGLGYFANSYMSPVSTGFNLTECQNTCSLNCSCVAFFFDKSQGRCYQYSQIGSLIRSSKTSSYSAFVKVPSESSKASNGGGDNNRGLNKGVAAIIAVIVAVSASFVICLIVYMGIRLRNERRKLGDEAQESSEDDGFLESLKGMAPVRYSFKELQVATDNFTTKLGQGGFGSVYKGVLRDGSQIAVKKLEGIGQGKKEFKAEVSIIGSIHHVHLVRLRGFCAEGPHRLLAYEFMANGSLDKWLFSKKEGVVLDWDKRYNIAIAMAKGLAYLHEDCSVKIVHCDIKPENVLLDDNFDAKVSDFGLAKLMNREQSHVFTTLRGTRGYLAPEWITNYAISEKSDVYSYGMVLLELIGGRKSFDPAQCSEKAHFPSYAFKRMEEGNLQEIMDSKMEPNHENDERVSIAIKVALWCIQEDMSMRPPMTKVAQMLEGVAEVPQLPPKSTSFGFRMYSSFLKSDSNEGSSSNPSDYYNSEQFVSAVRLSGPR